MPYAPEYGLVAYTFQLLSLSHSHFRYLNWNRGRQRNLRIMFHAISLARRARLSPALGTLANVRVWTNAPPAAELRRGPAPGARVTTGLCCRLDVRRWLMALLVPDEVDAQLVAAIVAARASAVALAAIVSLNLDVDVRSRTRDVDTGYFRSGTEELAVLNGHLDCVWLRRKFKATNQLHRVTFLRTQGAFVPLTLPYAPAARKQNRQIGQYEMHHIPKIKNTLRH